MPLNRVLRCEVMVDGRKRRASHPLTWRDLFDQCFYSGYPEPRAGGIRLCPAHRKQARTGARLYLVGERLLLHGRTCFRIEPLVDAVDDEKRGGA